MGGLKGSRFFVLFAPFYFPPHRPYAGIFFLFYFLRVILSVQQQQVLSVPLSARVLFFAAFPL